MTATLRTDSAASGRPGRVRAGVTAAVLLAVVAGALLGPWPASLGGGSTGDPQLAARLAEDAGQGRVGLAAAVVTADGTRLAAVGDDGNGSPLTPDTPMEVGSITKTFTGAVLADLARRGVVRPDERVRDLVPDRPWRPGGAGDVTLEELASHRSGLPAEPASAAVLLGNYGNGLFGLQPYRSDPDGVLAAADGATLSERGTSSYSNLGVALLGQVLAARAGVGYPELLRESVTGPLGMDATGPPAGGPPTGAAARHDETGRAVQAWVDPGDAPAGAGVYTTATDMAAYARAALLGTEPVVTAAEPRWPAEAGRSIGYGWQTRERDGRQILWHNGQSGGMSSSIVVDRSRGEAVVVLGNTTVPVDDVAFGLAGLSSSPRTELSAALDAPVGTAIGVVVPLVAGASLLAAARGGWGRTPGRPRRSRVVSAGAGTLFLFAVAFAYATPTWLLAPFWLAGCGLAGAGIGLAVTGWAAMDPDTGAGGRLRWAGAVTGLVLAVLLTVGVGGALV